MYLSIPNFMNEIRHPMGKSTAPYITISILGDRTTGCKFTSLRPGTRSCDIVPQPLARNAFTNAKLGYSRRNIVGATLIRSLARCNHKRWAGTAGERTEMRPGTRIPYTYQNEMYKVHSFPHQLMHLALFGFQTSVALTPANTDAEKYIILPTLETRSLTTAMKR